MRKREREREREGERERESKRKRERERKRKRERERMRREMRTWKTLEFAKRFRSSMPRKRPHLAYVLKWPFRG